MSSAEREYRAILRLDPVNVDVQVALGIALYGSGNFAEAVSILNQALELDKNQPRAELFLELSESSLGHCDRAVSILASNFPFEADPKLGRIVGLSLLDCESSAGDWGTALQTAQKLRDLFPDDPDVLYKSAELYTRLWNQAAAELIQKHPESYRVHQLAGEVFQAQDKYEQAIKEFRLALEENPRVPQLHLRIGELILKQDAENAQNGALAEFREELGINPSSGPAEYAIGEVYRARQDFQESKQHLQRAVQLDPEFTAAYLALAQVFLSRREYEKARESLDTAVCLQPDNPAIHYNLMLVYRGQNNTESAKQEMSIFQRLQQQDEMSFQNKLHSLLTGSAESASHAK